MRNVEIIHVNYRLLVLSFVESMEGSFVGLFNSLSIVDRAKFLYKSMYTRSYSLIFFNGQFRASSRAILFEREFFQINFPRV